MTGTPQEIFKQKLADVHALIKGATSFASDIMDIQPVARDLLSAERMNLFHCGGDEEGIVNNMTMPGGGGEIEQIKIPFSTQSVIGIVALSQKPLLIADLNDPKEVKAINPNLTVDKANDVTLNGEDKSMIAVPIKAGNVLLGVLQIVNHDSKGNFGVEDLKRCIWVSQQFGSAFHEELRCLKGPYDFLIFQGKMTREVLKGVEKRAIETRNSISNILLAEQGINKADLGRSMEQYYQVPYMGFEEDIELPKDVLSQLNLSVCRTENWVPVMGNETEIIVLIDDPQDQARTSKIEILLEEHAHAVAYRVGFKDDIQKFLTAAGAKEEGAFSRFMVEEEEEEPEEAEADIYDAPTRINLTLADGTQVIPFVNQLIVEADKAGASDIHIEPFGPRAPALVRVRVDGLCREFTEIPAEHAANVVARIKVMCRLDVTERRMPQDGKCKLEVDDGTLELRVATVPTVLGESAVMRLLSGGGALPIDKLNFSKHNMSRVKQMMSLPHGLVLVVGPTGSGKTTTLHAMLGELNKPDKTIWTAEDPVEITQPGLQQLQVDSGIGLGFADALRSFLRADPDIILIGEMRDKETAKTGVEASLTGHLVLSTLHTNSAVETITRLLDLGLDRINFSDAMIGIVAQRLIRVFCKCAKPHEPTEIEYQQLRTAYGEEAWDTDIGLAKADVHLKKKSRCAECGGTGYKGRTGIHEVLVSNAEMRHMINQAATIGEMTVRAKEDGMRSLFQDGVEKILSGETDMAQLLAVAAR
ncbi:MAG: Flp pilus assembly complex ATPase component TadA [Methylococcales bacterium]|jgi:type II secretory ATPase GspE/PulE/Tfp pilus assembly ATPase PilB-like protein|nr:Flp pilus assembly complex ATPase component TadA [Methylococcales bacterium]